MLDGLKSKNVIHCYMAEMREAVTQANMSVKY